MGSYEDDARAERYKATARRQANPGPPSPSEAAKAKRKAELFAYFKEVEAAEAAGKDPPPFPHETHPDGYMEEVNGRWAEWRGGRRVPLVPLDPIVEREAEEDAEHRAFELREDRLRFEAGIPFTPLEPDPEPGEGEIRTFDGRKVEFRGGKWLDLVTGEPARTSEPVELVRSGFRPVKPRIEEAAEEEDDEDEEDDE